MSHRLQQVNKHIQRTFGEILQKEADIPIDVLVTVSRAETTPNLKSTRIYLYIYPLERAEEILEHLTSQLYELQGAFNRALDLKPLPRIRLTVDYGAAHADNLDQTIKRLKKDGST